MASYIINFIKTRSISIFLLVIVQLFPAATLAGEEVCSIVTGAVIIAQDDENTFLGKITNTYDIKSIFNDYGTHGSEYSSSSIWNEYGTFGSEYSTFSPFNKYTSTPPMIIKNKKIIGYLSVNKNLRSAISPNLLKALCKDEL